MKIFDPRISKYIKFNHQPFYGPYKFLLETGRCDVMWDSPAEGYAFKNAYRKIHGSVIIPPTFMRIETYGEILNEFVNKNKGKIYDAMYFFNVKNIDEMYDIKDSLTWHQTPSVKETTDPGIKRLICNYFKVT